MSRTTSLPYAWRKDPDGIPFTDAGNAIRLVQAHGQDIRWAPHLCSWLVWEGRRWALDTTGEVERRAKDTIKGLRGLAQEFYEAAAEFERDSQEHAGYQSWADRLMKLAKDSEQSPRLAAMMRLAQTEPGVTVLPEQLDTDPMLLNVLNGTLDLTSGQRRPHNRSDLITKLVPVEYDETARSPEWERFLNVVTGGNRDMQTYLQRAAGYSLTGRTDDEALFLVHGPGGTGKTTFIEALRSVLGDYAKTTDFDTFTKRQNSGGPRNDIARLAGARFITASEVDEGRRLSEQIVKQFTGNDRVSARFLHREHFEFSPTGKLWLVANDKPIVRHEDDGLWRRMHLIPFHQVVAPADRNPRIKALLCDAKQSGAALLAWAVKGCLAWQRDGLGVPQSVRVATAKYREEMDPLKDFIEDCAELTPDGVVPIADLRRRYDEWADDSGYRYHLSPQKFNKLLEARGCTREQQRIGTGSRNARVWRGIQIVRPTLHTREPAEAHGVA
jgi:putative DNA primase/helicase